MSDLFGDDAKGVLLGVDGVVADAAEARDLLERVLDRANVLLRWWLAYVSNESGREEVYVRTFPEAHGKWQVSVDGGREPEWRRDGRELFYVAPAGVGDQRIMAAAVRTMSDEFTAGIPQVLFQAQLPQNISRNRYAVTADGQRFLLNVAAENPFSSPVTVTLDWPALLSR